MTTAEKIQHEIKVGRLNLENLVSSFLQSIKEQEHLNIFIETFDREALLQAKSIEEKIKNGKHGKLAGLVISIKDNICYKDHEVTASSKILNGFKSLFSSTVVSKLLSEDAIIIGRVNCDEFAMGGSNETSFYGPVKNPLNPKCVPGGSSGGSAAAVAANLCHVSIGTDTGGSIRQPAAFTGTVGFKPTYGRVSRHGLIAYASSFDQAGPIAKNVADASLVLEVISGNDGFDSTASSKKIDVFPFEKENTVKKIAVLEECISSQGLNKQVKDSFISHLEQLKQKGYTVEYVSFPYFDFLVPCYYILTTAEASSNLSRYDGVHFGYRSPNAFDLESTYKLSRTEGFGKEVKRRIMLGTFVLSAGYYDAYYAKAQKVRRMIYEKIKEIFSQYDIIAIPTTPNHAFEFGQKSDNPIEMYLEDIYTVLANLAGIPAISVPMKSETALPFGIQFMANAFEEKKLATFAHIFEQMKEER